jgi:hypothetical protein
LGESRHSSLDDKTLKGSSFWLIPQESTVLHSDSKDSFLCLTGIEIFILAELGFEGFIYTPNLIFPEEANELLGILVSLLVMRALEALESLG